MDKWFIQNMEGHAELQMNINVTSVIIINTSINIIGEFNCVVTM
jgi:hypothetical protein